MSQIGSSLKGKLVESLVALTCIHGSNAEINVAYPFVDDEGVDLIFYRRGGGSKILSAQVKSRAMQSSLLKRGTYRTQVRRQAFHPRGNYYLLLVALDEENFRLHEYSWFIPTQEFAEKTSNQKNKSVIVFQSNFDSKDMWEEYRIKLTHLPQRILKILS